MMARVPSTIILFLHPYLIVFGVLPCAGAGALSTTKRYARMGKTLQHVADSKRVAVEERNAFDRRVRTLQIQRARACQPKRASGRTATRKGRSKTPSPLPTPALTHVPQPPAAAVLPTIFTAGPAELPKKEIRRSSWTFSPPCWLAFRCRRLSHMSLLRWQLVQVLMTWCGSTRVHVQ